MRAKIAAGGSRVVTVAAEAPGVGRPACQDVVDQQDQPPGQHFLRRMSQFVYRGSPVVVRACRGQPQSLSMDVTFVGSMTKITRSSPGWR